MTEKPRILALFGSAVVFGAERGNIEALAALKEQGCEVLCLIRNESWSTHAPPALDARGLAWRKVPYIEHWMPGRLRYVLFRNPFAFLIANWKFMRIVREFQPTHIHAFNQLYVLNFLIGLMLVRTPMIFRAGDEPTLHNWVWRATWRLVVRHTTRFVANAQFVARSLRQSGVPAERITVIYNAPPARPRLVPQSLDVTLPPGTRAFGYIGQIAEHKGPHLLIEAFREFAAQYPQTHLLIAGRISEWEGDAWARALRDSTVQDPLIGKRITFLAEIENVPGLLARCEALVVPSLFADPSPNVVMEAKQAGRAAIVFPRGGIPELIEHGVDGLVCLEPTVPALVDALRTYLDDPPKAAVHGLAARASLDRLGVPEFGQKWGYVYGIDHDPAAREPQMATPRGCSSRSAHSSVPARGVE